MHHHPSPAGLASRTYLLLGRAADGYRLHLRSGPDPRTPPLCGVRTVAGRGPDLLVAAVNPPDVPRCPQCWTAWSHELRLTELLP